MKLLEKQKAFEDLKQKLETDISLPLYSDRIKNNYKPVLGEGSLDAQVIFIGEAPGKNEAEQGRPFVGAAGKLLTEFIAQAGLAREEVYITSILQDRPPGNRDPEEREILAYSPFIFSLLKIIQPTIIVTLGRFSLKAIFELCKLPLKSIGQIHGQQFKVKTSYGEVIIVPMYHPASAFYTRTLKEVIQKDFEKLGKLLPTSLQSKKTGI